MKLTFTINFNSDYHTGAGHGLGTDIDSALLRDGDGVPCLRGTTIEGILKYQLKKMLELKPLKSVKQVACLDGCAPESKPCPVCRIFGSPSFPKRWCFRSARPVGVDDPVGEKTWLPGRTASSVIWQNRISPRTGRTEANKLFSRERGSSELCFKFEVECRQDYPEVVADASLLVASVRMSRSIGSGKSRGLGDCVIDLKTVSEDVAQYLAGAELSGPDYEGQLLKYFADCILGGKDHIEVKISRPEWQKTNSGNSDNQKARILVIARSEEPLVLACKMESGNQYGGLDYIPGGTLLGAMAYRAASKWDLSDVKSNLYRDFVSTFRRGKARFSMLYPAYEKYRSIYPCIPAPLDLLSCKIFHGFSEFYKELHGVKAYAHEEKIDERCDKCKDKITPLQQLVGYVRLRQPRETYLPRMRQETHIRIDPVRGRAATGDLFGYTAIESGQFFLGEIYCESKSDWSTLCRLADIPEGNVIDLQIGKGIGRGYGKLKVKFQMLAPDKPGLLIGEDIGGRVDDVEKPLVMTLLSDAVLPDQWGRFRQGFSGEWFLEQLGAGFNISGIKVIQAFCRTGTIAGFNGRLGLPRWQDKVLKAGTTVGFRIEGTVDLEKLKDRLRTMEWEGIGLRREEGFGMVAFNHPIRTGGVGREPVNLNDNEEMIIPSGVDKAMQFYRKSVFQGGKYRMSGKKYRDERWLAVARWLKGNAGNDLDELINQLKDEAFPGSLEKLFNVKDYKFNTDNFFTKDAKEGMDLLVKELEGIQKENLHGQLLQIALEKVAGSIIEACSSGKEE